MPTAWEATQIANTWDSNNLDPFGVNATGVNFWGDNAVAPVNTQVDYGGFGYNPNFAQQNAPTWHDFGQAAPQYQGLSNGDYQGLQQALTAPGQIAANTAYTQAKTDLSNAMGGNGLYGSSMMGQQLSQNLGANYLNTLATNSANAAAQRYGMQQRDLQFGQSQAQNAWQAELGQNNAQNQFNMSNYQLGLQANQQGFGNAMQDAAWRSQQDNLQGNFQNMLGQQQQAYQTQQYGDLEQQRENALNRASTFWQGTDPDYARLRNKQAEEMDQQIGSSGGLGGILGSAGGMLGSLFNNGGSLLGSLGVLGSPAGF
jgi:hypothetical protein